MTISSIAFHLFHGPHSGYIVGFAASILLAVRSCFVDVFIDESESASSEIAKEKWGIKATKINRPIMVSIFLSTAAFAVWKMWQP